VALRRPDWPGADVLLRDEGEHDALRDRHTEWSRITLGGKGASGRGDADRPNDFSGMAARSNQDDRFCGKFSR
jgi:hypothetical protein